MFKIYNGKFPIWSDGDRFSCEIKFIGRPMTMTMQSKYGAIKLRDPQAWVDSIADRLRELELDMITDEFYDEVEIGLALLHTCSNMYEEMIEINLDTC